MEPRFENEGGDERGEAKSCNPENPVNPVSKEGGQDSQDSQDYRITPASGRAGSAFLIQCGCRRKPETSFGRRFKIDNGGQSSVHFNSGLQEGFYDWLDRRADGSCGPCLPNP